MELHKHKAQAPLLLAENLGRVRMQYDPTHLCPQQLNLHPDEIEISEEGTLTLTTLPATAKVFPGGSRATSEAVTQALSTTTVVTGTLDSQTPVTRRPRLCEFRLLTNTRKETFQLKSFLMSDKYMY